MRSKRKVMAHAKICNATYELQRGRKGEARGDNANTTRQRLEEIEVKGAHTLTSNFFLAPYYETALTGKGIGFTTAAREQVCSHISATAVSTKEVRLDGSSHFRNKCQRRGIPCAEILLG